MRDDGLLPVVLAPTAPGNATTDVGGTIVLELGLVRVRIESEPKAAALAHAPLDPLPTPEEIRRQLGWDMLPANRQQDRAERD